MHLTSPSLNLLLSHHTITELAEEGHQDLDRMTAGDTSMVALRSHEKGGIRAAQNCRPHHRYPKALEEGIAISILSCPGLYLSLCSVELNMHLWSAYILVRQGRVLRTREISSTKPILPV